MCIFIYIACVNEKGHGFEEEPGGLCGSLEGGKGEM